MSRKIPIRLMLAAVILGCLSSLATGLVENRPDVGIPEDRYYGYPLAWRMTSLNAPDEHNLGNLAIDAVFWVAILLFAFLILWRIVPKRLYTNASSNLLFLIVAFLLLGLAMDFVHEFGHVFWGVILGGRLAYVKLIFFEIYPRFAVSSDFVLGLVRVEGLSGFEHGMFLLGGSLSTSIAAWVTGLILLKKEFTYMVQTALWIFGLFGVLDLPFYVFLPQLGLQHWVFIGGGSPEPLIGARSVGIPDIAFYAIVLLTTFGSALLYLKPLRQRTMKVIRRLLASARVVN